MWWPDWTNVWQNNEIRGSDQELQWNWKERFQFMALRNGANNMRFWFKQPVTYKSWGYDGEMESQPMKDAGIQITERWRQVGWMFSYRRLWLINNYQYREFYVGWKIGSSVPGMGFTLQNRKGTIGN